MSTRMKIDFNRRATLFGHAGWFFFMFFARLPSDLLLTFQSCIGDLLHSTFKDFFFVVFI